jgi:membrane protein implicated in regulation of membrane protease activity
VRATILAAEIVAANPGPAVHLAVVGFVILVALAAYMIARRRRRRVAADAERRPDSHEASSLDRGFKTPPEEP